MNLHLYPTDLCLWSGIHDGSRIVFTIS